MYYIYKITNKINGKFYIGRHKSYKNLYAKGQLTRRQNNINKLLLIEELDKKGEEQNDDSTK